jgi:hypothetical protein
MQSDLHELINIAKGLGMTSMVWSTDKDRTPRVTVASWPVMESGETEMEALVKLISKLRPEAGA